MERREAVKDMALYLGLALSVPTFSALFGSCKTENKKQNLSFSQEDQLLIEDIANTIIPDTDTPGAKAAGVGAFITMMVNDCYEKTDQRRFTRGLKKVNRIANRQFGKKFQELSVERKTELLTTLAEDSKNFREEERKRKQTAENIDARGSDAAQAPTGEEDNAEHYFFPIMHELTLLGYFTSEIGATQALAYVPIPATFEPCTQLAPDQKAWAVS